MDFCSNTSRKALKNHADIVSKNENQQGSDFAANEFIGTLMQI